MHLKRQLVVLYVLVTVQLFVVTGFLRICSWYGVQAKVAAWFCMFKV